MLAPPKPPPHDELEALLKEARARQLRRRLLGAAGVAIAAAIGLSAYALTVGGGDEGATGNGSPRVVPLCRSSQLSASSYWNGAAGTLINFFTVVNRSGSACSLPSGPPLVRLNWHGSSLNVQESRPDGGFGFAPRSKPRRILTTGQSAVVYMQWSNWCDPPQARFAANVVLRFRDGLRVTARNVLGQPPCLNRAGPSLLVVSRPLAPN